jgi:ABC-type polysaccharide/polyol phosphate transport system ATPase subunit
VTAPAIEVANVWKRFRVQRERPDSLKERVTSRRRGHLEEFWALKDVSLTIPHGSFYGLVGHNGSGKSSLLRILANIYPPTRGEVTTDGRVSALLELGAGFHPDLTGRENIYLNAAILGLSKRETDDLYDEIVDFSELADFIDTPGKHFSSGMYVRLGFSVAVHVEPQILLVDEVIAVGDEEFQRRCFEHLNKLRRRGVTIVLVTHSLQFVQTLCDEATWLDHGEVLEQGSANQVVHAYLDRINAHEVERLEVAAARAEGDETAEPGDHAPSGRPAVVEGVELLGPDGRETQVGVTLSPLTVRVRWRADEPIEEPLVSLVFWTEGGLPIANPGMVPARTEIPTVRGRGHADYHVERLVLSPGTYRITAALHDSHAMTVYHRLNDAGTLRVHPGEVPVYGVVDLIGTWTAGRGSTTAGEGS